MNFNRKKQTYTLTHRDLGVMAQAKIGILDTADVMPKHPGLPPIWSRMAYVMLQTDKQTNQKCYWQAYRELGQLLEDVNGHYRKACIPKASGEKRRLRIPDGMLRYHQAYILREILQHIPVSEHAFAYRKGLGIAQLARPHKGHRTLVHMDIRNFFSDITEQKVFESLMEQTGYSKSVCGMLSRLCCHYGRLPQGACTSPALSNICFRPCDDMLAHLADALELTYTRYSDDLYFSGDAVDPEILIPRVKQILQYYGFRLNAGKTRVYGQHQAQKVTSIVVNEKVQVARQYRRQLRQELYYLRRFGSDALAAREYEYFEDYLYRVLGRISFVLYVDPTNEEFREARNDVMEMLFRGYCYALPF